MYNSNIIHSNDFDSSRIITYRNVSFSYRVDSTARTVVEYVERGIKMAEDYEEDQLVDLNVPQNVRKATTFARLFCHYTALHD